MPSQMAEETEKSKILMIGATGSIGKHIVKASVLLGHPTFALVRDLSPTDTVKAQLLYAFKTDGVTLLKGDIYNKESLLSAIQHVDVVISAVGFQQLKDQTLIIDAIQEAGSIKRFIPSEFGNDVDRVHAEEPAKSGFQVKARVRRAVEASGIPYTFVSSNSFAGCYLPTLAQVGAEGLPIDKVTIFGDGNVKGIFVNEDDIATYTILAADDQRTMNKILYLRPPANTLSQNELISLWEKKVNKTFDRVYVSEQEVLKLIKEAPFPLNMSLALYHSLFVKGDHVNFDIKPEFGVEAIELYPDVKYTTVDEYLNQFL